MLKYVILGGQLINFIRDNYGQLSVALHYIYLLKFFRGIDMMRKSTFGLLEYWLFNSISDVLPLTSMTNRICIK